MFLYCVKLRMWRLTCSRLLAWALAWFRFLFSLVSGLQYAWRVGVERTGRTVTSMWTRHLCRATYGRVGNPHTGDPVTNFPKGLVGMLVCRPSEYVCVCLWESVWRPRANKTWAHWHFHVCWADQCGWCQVDMKSHQWRDHPITKGHKSDSCWCAGFIHPYKWRFQKGVFAPTPNKHLGCAKNLSVNSS